MGVVANSKNGKLATELEQTSTPHVYAIGDVLEDKPELTPVAIQAGVLLAKRLFGGSKEAVSGLGPNIIKRMPRRPTRLRTAQMDYSKVATAVFTPLEYGACGLSEEAALEAFGGESNVEVFHISFAPLEWALSPDREPNNSPCFAKVICDKSKPELPVLGMHYLGPNAGEVIQGYAVAVKMGCSYNDLLATVGIHPTTSEQFTTMKVTKSSGASAAAAGC